MERRKQERFDLEVPVLMKLTGGAAKDCAHECVTRDISSGGAFFVSPEAFEVGQKFQANIKFPAKGSDDQGVWVFVRGDVLHLYPDGAGAMFDRNYQVLGIRDSRET